MHRHRNNEATQATILPANKEINQPNAVMRLVPSANTRRSSTASRRSSNDWLHRRNRLSKRLHIRFDLLDTLADAFELLAVFAVLLRSRATHVGDRCGKIADFRIIYLWEVIVWDKMLGLGTTDPMIGMIADWTGTILTAYVAGRSIEKVARVLRR